MDARTVAQVLAIGRTGLGLALFVAPARSARGWLGADVDRPGAKVAIRGLGARDVALGIGTLAALEQQGSARHWVEAGVISDVADSVATWGIRQERPTLRWGAALGLGLSAGAIGTWVRAQLGDD